MIRSSSSTISPSTVAAGASLHHRRMGMSHANVSLSFQEWISCFCLQLVELSLALSIQIQCFLHDQCLKSQ